MTDMVVPPASQSTVTAAETRMRKANAAAYDDLINSMEEETCFGLVSEAITNDLPEGDARLAWKNLCARYQPKTGAACVLLKQKFAQTVLDDPSKDPDTWVSNLEHLRIKMVMREEVEWMMKIY